LVCNWTKTITVNQIPLDIPVKIAFDSDSTSTVVEELSSPITEQHIKYNSKVMILSGTSKMDSSKLATLIKFMVGKKDRSELLCPGGAWDPAIDGPIPNDESLIRTAIRSMKAYSDIDLSRCTKWFKFMEIHYARPATPDFPAHTEITVIYIPDAWTALPSVEEFSILYHKRKLEAAVKKEDKSNVPLTNTETTQSQPPTLQETSENVDGNPHQSEGIAQDKLEEKEIVETLNKSNNTIETSKEKQQEKILDPCFYVESKKFNNYKLKYMTISLDGLLDYDEGDKFEATFEVSLFGELFYEMLERDYGYTILNFLNGLPDKVNNKETKKRGREETHEETVKTPEEAEKKRKVDLGDEQKEDELGAISSTPEQPQQLDSNDNSNQEIPVLPITDTQMKEPSEESKSEISNAGANTEQLVTPVIEQHQPVTTKTEMETEEIKIVNQKVIDPKILEAFEFFDKNKTGYIKADDLETILFYLGENLSLRYVHNLLNKTTESSRILYREL